MAKADNVLPEDIYEESRLLGETDSSCQRCLKAMTIEWRMLLYKIQYFFVMGAESVDRVYLQLFMRQSGQSPTRIGIVTGVGPFAVCLANTIGGIIAKKYGSSKSVLLVASFLAACIAFGISVLPTPRQSNSNCTLDISALNISSLDSQLDLAWQYGESNDNFFYVLLIAHTTFSVFRCLTLAFTDVALMSALGEAGMHKYPRQKSFGSLGSTFLDLGTGAIVGALVCTKTICGIDMTFSDYQVAYYIVGVALFICFLDSWTFPFADEKTTQRVTALTRYEVLETNSLKLNQESAKNEAKDTKIKKKADDSQFRPKRLASMLCSVHYASWLLCVFYTGFCLALSTYTYLYLEILGGDAYLIGVVSGVSAASDFTFYVVAFWIVQKLGTVHSLYFSLLGYAIRFTILATIDDPWLGLFQAVLNGCTNSVSWMAMIQHVAKRFSNADRTIVIGIVHGLYFGLAYGIGELVGGAVINDIGAKYTFGIMAKITVPLTGLFYLLQKLSKPPSCEVMYDKEEEAQEQVAATSPHCLQNVSCEESI